MVTDLVLSAFVVDFVCRIMVMFGLSEINFADVNDNTLVPLNTFGPEGASTPTKGRLSGMDCVVVSFRIVALLSNIGTLVKDDDTELCEWHFDRTFRST